MANGDESIGRGKTGRVQVRRTRKNGWTGARRAAFLDHLAASCNVARSAEAAGMKGDSAYALRRKDPDFAEAWNAALAAGYARLEGMLIERAAGGPSDPGAPAIDSELALSLLRHHRGPLQGRPRGGGPKPRVASMEEVRAAIAKQLKALNKRLGGKG